MQCAILWTLNASFPQHAIGAMRNPYGFLLLAREKTRTTLARAKSTSVHAATLALLLATLATLATCMHSAAHCGAFVTLQGNKLGQ
jgi:hypothetical protein